MTESQTEYLDDPALETKTGISRKTWQRHRLHGTGPSFIKAGRRVLYDLKDVESWLNSRKVTSTSAYTEGA